jgi:hypothetical protein
MIARLNEGRKKGQLQGARANREKAIARRDALVKCTKKLWSDNPALRNHFLPTARQIERMKLPELRLKEYGQNFLGVDAIRKHLRAAREDL